MRYTTATMALVLAALVTGCSGGSASDDKAPDQLQAERDARESADPSLKDVRTCTVLVTGRVNTGWRQTINAEVAEDQRQAALEFDRTYPPGSPEYDSFIQRFQEGLPPIKHQIITEGRDRDEVLLEQTAEVSEFVKQDCTVAYKR